MKLTQKQLRKIVNEEVTALREGKMPPYLKKKLAAIQDEIRSAKEDSSLSANEREVLIQDLRGDIARHIDNYHDGVFESRLHEGRRASKHDLVNAIRDEISSVREDSSLSADERTKRIKDLRNDIERHTDDFEADPDSLKELRLHESADDESIAAYYGEHLSQAVADGLFGVGHEVSASALSAYEAEMGDDIAVPVRIEDVAAYAESVADVVMADEGVKDEVRRMARRMLINAMKPKRV